jgi:outer membrane lipopolysaccharide assembly protein LptE/RlpB
MDGWFRSSLRSTRCLSPQVLSLLACVCVALAATGCGYSLAGRGSQLPPGFEKIKTVAIPAIENRTSYSRVEQLMTDRLRSEFIGRRGKYTPVNEESGAEASLRVQIVSFTLQPSGLNQQQLTSRYLVTIVLKVSFVDLKNPDPPLWSNDALTFRDEYDLGTTNTNNPSLLVDQSKSVVDRISQDAARTIVTAIFEAF